MAYYESMRQQLRSDQVRKVRHIHELEQEISRLEALPRNPGRVAAIRTLRKRLAAESAWLPSARVHMRRFQVRW